MSVVLEPSSHLSFRRPLTQVSKELLMVINPSNDPVMFKVKTTAPKQYCVRPNAGRVEANSQVEVQVILQPFKDEPPADFKCKDKFLVQTAVIKPAYETLTVAEMWARVDAEDKGSIFQQKIRCTFLPFEETPKNWQQQDVQPEVSNHILNGSSAFKEQETPAYVPVTAPAPKPEFDPVPEPEPVPVVPAPKARVASPSPPPQPEPVREEPPSSPETPVFNSVAPAAVAPVAPAPVVAPPPKQPAPSVEPSVPSPVKEQPTQAPPVSRAPEVTSAAPTPAAPTPAASGDSKEKIRLQQELSDMQALVLRLQEQITQLKKEQEKKAAQEPVSRKAASAHPQDAVHQHLAALEKPRPIEGYPPQVVLMVAAIVFVFTYLFF